MFYNLSTSATVCIPFQMYLVISNSDFTPIQRITYLKEEGKCHGNSDKLKIIKHKLECQNG